VAAIMLAMLAASAGAQTLTADLSSHVIGITTGFVGADLVLFGSVEKPGDIIVVVRGPPARMTVRRKERIVGVWVNGSSVTFDDAPSFYAVLATRPLEALVQPDILARYNIGLDNLRLEPVHPVPPDRLAIFRSALLANQEGADLYRATPGRVTMLSEHLFRADMSFPATVPTGNYSIEVLLVAGGQVAGAQTTPLIVSRIGFSNRVFAIANRHSTLYGAGALLIAVAAGWAAGAVFRRV
jgi:uncharacterized protein (TIGR02186 family)